MTKVDTFGGTVVDDAGRERLRVFHTARVIERIDAAIDEIRRQVSCTDPREPGGCPWEDHTHDGTDDTGRPS